MKKQYLFCLLVALVATNSFANNSGWSSVNKKSATGTQNKDPSRNSNSLVSELLSQVQQMQQEMSELRGLSEQQAHEIRLLKQSQKDSYQDVDKRLRALSEQRSESVTTQTTAPKKAVKRPSPKARTTTTANYQTAMQLVRAKKYNQAIKEFETFYKANPKSKLAANSLYWIGEIQMVKADIKGAEANFLKVTQKFPNHLKSADAHYKLAMIKHKQGDVKGSKAQLKALIKNYAGKSERIVRLAKAYLKRLEKS